MIIPIVAGIVFIAILLFVAMQIAAIVIDAIRVNSEQERNFRNSHEMYSRYLNAGFSAERARHFANVTRKVQFCK